MPLLDLKTDLKSLKYGSDQPGGGSSGQPYVTTDINTVDTGFNRFRITKFDDGLVRGGTVGATNASVVDTIRIGKFLKDFPKGPLFITKQVGLQLSNPRLETKRGVGNFSSQSTRIYNLGVNTLAQVPVNAFGGHLNRHGLTPIQDNQTKYFYVALNNNDKNYNRLVKLKDKLIGTEENIIDSYAGGASSVYGIGRTLIKRRGDFIVVNQDITENEWAIKGAKEAGVGYRISGHEGGTRDGYIDASRRILNFTNLSNKSGSLFALSPLFFEDGGSIQDVFGGRRRNTPLGLNDQISSANDIINSKYNALVQEASASNSMRIPTKFTGVSTRVSSLFTSNTFPNLTSIGTYKRITLDDNVASINDVTDSKYNALVQEASASNSMRISTKFVGASTKIFSLFTPVNFPNLTSIGTYKRTTLDDNIASINDIINSKYNASVQEASASDSMRIPTKFVGVSNKMSSLFAPNIFPNLTSNTNKPQTLDDKTIKTYKSSFFGYNGGSLIIKNDLGLSNLSKNIAAASNGIPVDINDIKTSLNQNAINYIAPNLKTYAELRSKINNTSKINHTTPNGGKNFKTADVSINRGATNFQYIGRSLNIFDRKNDKSVDDDEMVLKFIPLNPFEGTPLNTLLFLGYITDYSEDYNSTWNDVKYNGRAEKFYIFNEFKRTATVGFQIPCYNKKELLEKHCNLNKLASVLAGKYTNTLLGGIITRLTVGNYINNQPGIITNLNFSPIQDSSWDLDDKLAYYLKVSFGFTLIHDFLPQYNSKFINVSGCNSSDEIIPSPSPTPAPTPAPIPTPPSPTPLPSVPLRPNLRNSADSSFYRFSEYSRLGGTRSSVTEFRGGSFGGAGAGGDF